MDASQQIVLDAFIPSLDQDFRIEFNAQTNRKPLEELRYEAAAQKERLVRARKKLTGTAAGQAEAVLNRIENQQLLEHIDSLIEAAQTDADAVTELDRQLRELAAEIDEIEELAECAPLLANTQELPVEAREHRETGIWRIQIEHKPVGNVPDPDIGGCILPPSGQSIEGFTIELVDLKTRWRSERISLPVSGEFMTQLYAEKNRRHEFAFELCDTTGTRIPTSPDRVFYTLGVIPDENPPAAKTIGVGCANGEVAVYVKKGDELPRRKTMDHFTTEPIRAGRAEDV